MDLGFFRRIQEGAGRSSADLDYGVLTAALQAFQSGSVTARAQAHRGDAAQAPAVGHDALVELLLGGPGWREAVERQGGSFNPAYVRDRGNNA